ncbi:MAG: IS110 family transposase [Acidobacteria bacterium]|nr:IS110 family transposase [Acidobacteriota bacterium]
MSGNVSVFVGLDYHQSFVQVCVLASAGRVLMNRRCANGWRELAEAVNLHVPQGGLVFAAIEACTGAADLAQELIDHAGWSVALAHPGYVARIKQSPDKTDFGDARVLADLERVGYLPKVWLAPQALRDLRQVVRYRQQLAAEKRNTKLRITALLREHRVETQVRRWTRVWLKWLESCEMPPESRWVIDRHLERLQQLQVQLKQVELRLAEKTAADPLVQRLVAYKGIGLVTAVTLRAEIGRFDRFRTGKQLARFCGTSPRNASSGQRQADAGLIKAGHPELRRVLIETAHRLARYDRRWSQLATKLRLAGKPGSVVVAAIANRWLRWLYHQVKDLAV